MIIVSDTSVISNLIQLGHIHLLKDLFDEVIIPQEVKSELNNNQSISLEVARLPWLKTIKIRDQQLFNSLLTQLDAGESEAIVLAIQLKADVLLIDEKKGRRIALQNNIHIIGLLGILVEAKKAGVLDKIKPSLEKLVNEIGFRVSPHLCQNILKLVGEA